MRLLIASALLATCSACAIVPSVERQFDGRAELEKLDGPDVPTLETSLERSAKRALDDGLHERSIGLYQQLIDANPEDVNHRFGMAEALRRMGEYKAAVIMYDDVISKQPEPLEAYEGKALALMAQGDTEAAARILQQVLTKDRARWRTLNALGILFASKPMFSEANTYMNEALRVSPNNPSVMNNMALISAMQHQYPAAIETLKQAASASTEEKQREQIDMNRALIHGISGELQEAENVASKYLKGGALQNNLGLYAYLSDNRELALSYLNMALSGSNSYYKRAWENMDIINNKNDSTRDQSIPSSDTSKTLKIKK